MRPLRRRSLIATAMGAVFHRLAPRLILRREDGTAYLMRWGFSTRLGGVFVHEFQAPDPGIELHDHPWTFVSFVVTGRYTEMTWATFSASLRARWAEDRSLVFATDVMRELYSELYRGRPVIRRAWSFNVMRQNRAHRIITCARDTWTVVVHGPRRRDRKDQRSDWGFYLPDGWVDEVTYAEDDYRKLDALIKPTTTTLEDR